MNVARREKTQEPMCCGFQVPVHHLGFFVGDGSCTGLLTNAFQLLAGVYASRACASSSPSIGRLMGSGGSPAHGPQISKPGNSSALQASVAF